jgi:hypothetical protein
MSWETVGRTVETGLWAILVAALIFFCAFVVPTLPAYWARAQIIRIQQIEAENAYYCEKLEMNAGTPKHSQCLLYLGEFRQKVGNRFADENQFP